MADSGNTENLTREQTHTMLSFLLHRMEGNVRMALMAEMPVAYARLYPDVSLTTILGNVEERIAGK